MKQISTHEENLILIQNKDFESLYRKNYGQIKKQINYMKQPNHMFSDLLQSSRIGLFLAMESFEPERGAWAPHMIFNIRKEMIDFLNKNSRTVRLPVNVIYDKEREKLPTEYMISLDTSLYDDGEALYSTIAYDDTQYTEKDTSKLREVINELKPRWQTIMLMRLSGASTEEISSELENSNNDNWVSFVIYSNILHLFQKSNLFMKYFSFYIFYVVFSLSVQLPLSFVSSL